MSLDIIVHYTCEAKKALGKGDPYEGESDILNGLKARNYQRTLEQVAKQQGKNPKDMKATINTKDEEGRPISEQVSYAELVKKGQPLLQWESSCTNCPANAFQRPFGCHAAVKYPIKQAGEVWLMKQVQRIDTPGGQCLEPVLRDADPEIIQNMRNNGLFEAKKPCFRNIGIGSEGDKRLMVSSNDLLACLFGYASSNSLHPGFINLYLMCLGALLLDDNPIDNQESFSEMFAMDERGDVEERLKRTSFAFMPDPNPDVLAMQSLILSLYYCWRTNSDFIFDA